MHIKNTCPICKNDKDITPLVNIGKHHLNYYKCPHCDVLYIDNGVHVKPNYNLEYNSFFRRPSDAEKAGIFARKIADLIGLPNQGKSIMEVGCGNGWTSFLLKQLGYLVTSHEQTEEYAFHLAKQLGLNMIWGEFEYLQHDKQYDLISASHVIEHSSSPVDFAIQCNNLLTEWGLLHIDTPTLETYTGDLNNFKHLNTRHPNEHVIIYSRCALDTLLFDHGFVPLHKEVSEQYHSITAIYQKVADGADFSR